MDQEIQTALEQRDARIDALSESIERLTDSIAADLDRRKADASERQRAAEISALCKQAGYADAEQLIADEQLGIEEARQKVFAWMVERNKSLNVGGDGLGTDWPTGTDRRTAQPMAGARAAFAASRIHRPRNVGPPSMRRTRNRVRAGGSVRTSPSPRSSLRLASRPSRREGEGNYNTNKES